MIRMVLLIAMLALAGCRGSVIDNAAVDVGDLNEHVSAPTVAEVLAQGNDAVAAQPAPVAFDHAGSWAATPAACGAEAWRFTRGAVATADGVSCRIRKADAISRTSTRLELECRAEGFATIENWALNLHEDGRMSVARTEGGNGAPRSVTLSRCAT